MQMTQLVESFSDPCQDNYHTQLVIVGIQTLCSHLGVNTHNLLVAVGEG